MGEERLFINSGSLKIEALLDKKPGEKGVVITHPHPLFGGEMENNVVKAIVQAFGEMGYTTLRFNFRGVGGSEGSYDEGCGEQDDVAAALGFLAGIGKTHLYLAGYSFGAWVNFLGLSKYREICGLVMVAPPVGLLDFGIAGPVSKVKLVITGSKDDIAEFRAVQEKVKAWNPEAVFRVVEGADHFYWGKAHGIREIIKEHLKIEEIQIQC
ncbi:MAG: alpha/beta hydrolase [Deltaproteobacteria bacterium]|nr:alpha/beta hydrolase [Deltaproteobacteria bacterium]